MTFACTGGNESMYRPNSTDRRFAKAMCRLMKEDGVWIAGNTGLLYRFNRSNRTMTVNP